jgi:hypothetical protein
MYARSSRNGTTTAQRKQSSLGACHALVAAILGALLVTALPVPGSAVADAAGSRLKAARDTLHDREKRTHRLRRQAHRRCRTGGAPRCRAARRRLATAVKRERAARRVVRRLLAERARRRRRPSPPAPSNASPPAAAVAPAPFTHHVAPTGNDANPGTSTRPFRTIGAALARALPGQRVLVASGSYPKITDTRARTGTVELAGAGPASTRVAGMEIAGGQGLDIHGLGFTSTVKITEHPTRYSAQPAVNVTLRQSDITTPGICLYVRSGARSIRVLANRIHHCYSGIVGPGNTAPSTGITIERNTIEQVTADAIQFGDWNHVRIAYNTLRGMRDPTGQIHNDGIQFTGDSRRVDIVANRITDSRSQLLFIQDAIGPIDDVTVENNVIAHAGAVAVQVQGATRTRFVHNTVWDGNYGGLWLRQGYKRGSSAPVVATDTVVANNVLSSFRLLEGAGTALAAGNITQCASGQAQTTSQAGGWTCLPAPGFVAEGHDDYRLVASAAARRLGSARATTARDIADGVRTGPPVPGAHR